MLICCCAWPSAGVGAAAGRAGASSRPDECPIPRGCWADRGTSVSSANPFAGTLRIGFRRPAFCLPGDAGGATGRRPALLRAGRTRASAPNVFPGDARPCTTRRLSRDRRRRRWLNTGDMGYPMLRWLTGRKGIDYPWRPQHRPQADRFIYSTRRWRWLRRNRLTCALASCRSSTSNSSPT